MKSNQNIWAVVLAAGDGTRLAELTRDARGNPVPKQFCSLNGGPSLLHDALERARQIVSRDRLCTIVAEQHRAHWRSALWFLPNANLIKQPVNRGTAHGVLLSALSILGRDPLARIVFLPADHYVRNERALAGALREATSLIADNPNELVLIGIEPDEPDPELGYIVPGERLPDGSQTVQAFVEKPDPVRARQLLRAGALWNSFIFAASAASLVWMIRRKTGDVVERMESALARDFQARGSRALMELYAQLPPVDFSRRIVEGSEGFLRVIRAPACGWSDLGTPARVAATLQRLKDGRLARHMPTPWVGEGRRAPAAINLADRHLLMGTQP
jgi:mannose-1-phosphate guanylyltransferase